jgi:hypothetical protein
LNPVGTFHFVLTDHSAGMHGRVNFIARTIEKADVNKDK